MKRNTNPSSSKFEERYHGPFQVTSRKPDGGYFLLDRDGTSMVRAVPHHQLKLFMGTDAAFGESADVHAIVAQRNDRNGQEYRVRWKNLSASDDTWLQEADFDGKDAIRKYWAKVQPKGQPHANITPAVSSTATNPPTSSPGATPSYAQAASGPATTPSKPLDHRRTAREDARRTSLLDATDTIATTCPAIDRHLVGRSILMFWNTKNTWERATIRSWHTPRGDLQHNCVLHYRDGSRRDRNLTAAQYLGPASDVTSTTTP
jgi:hypothetical protein